MDRIKLRKLVWLCCLYGGQVSWVARPTCGGTLEVAILDESGVATPARVYLINTARRGFIPTECKKWGDDCGISATAGRYVFPPAALRYQKWTRFGSEQDFVPHEGKFQIELPAGTYEITVERGKEYLPATEQFALLATGTLQRTIRLKRWIRMSDLGWYSGDMHTHVTLHDLALMMRAEDLNIALPITLWRQPGQPLWRDPGLEACLEKADGQGFVQMDDQHAYSCINEELETLESALLVSRVGRSPVPLEYPYAQFGLAAHARGALLDSEKATSLELPVMAALGACDFIGVANNHMWRSGCDRVFWGVWPGLLPSRYPSTCVGFARAGFDLYDAFLNMGFPFNISAGSARGVHPVPFGWSRIYVHVPKEFNLGNWFLGLKQGHSFATTGPMLLMKANGLEPGEETRDAAFPLKVSVDVTMLSATPVREAEVVVNGSADVVTLEPDSQAPGTYRGNLQISLPTSSWVAARYLQERGRTVEVAHTSPVYFWDRHSPIPARRQDAAYFLDRLRKLTEEVETGRAETGGRTSITTPTPRIKSETLEFLRQARALYQSKLSQAGQ